MQTFGSKPAFQKNYKELLAHYNIQGEHTNPKSPNENGSCEKSHDLFKTAVDQSLLQCKPGAFRNFKYHDDLIPGVYFRVAYDQLSKRGKTGEKEYLAILQCAADHGEESVRKILAHLAETTPITLQKVKEHLERTDRNTSFADEDIPAPTLADYDTVVRKREVQA